MNTGGDVLAANQSNRFIRKEYQGLVIGNQAANLCC
jgi:hypothetical protein